MSFLKHMQSIFWNVDVLTFRLVCYICGHRSDIVDLVNCRQPHLDFLHNLDGYNRWNQSSQNEYSCYYFHYHLTGFDCVGSERWTDLGVSSCIAGRNWIACDIGWQMEVSVGAAKALLPILHQKHGSNKCYNLPPLSSIFSYKSVSIFLDAVELSWHWFETCWMSMEKRVKSAYSWSVLRIFSQHASNEALAAVTMDKFWRLLFQQNCTTSYELSDSTTMLYDFELLML